MKQPSKSQLTGAFLLLALMLCWLLARYLHLVWLTRQPGSIL